MPDKKNTLQIGRSMIEIIAVLAIIGILTALSLTLYSYLINKHRANNTIYDTMLRATNVPMYYETYKEANEGTLFNFPDLGPTTPDSYPTQAIREPLTSPYIFRVEVSAIPNEVCRHLIDLNPTDIDLIKINSTERSKPDSTSADCSKQKLNTFYFYFEPTTPSSPEEDDDIQEGGCTEDSCENCHFCDSESGQCVREDCPILTCPTGSYATGVDDCNCIISCQDCPEFTPCNTCFDTLYDAKGCPTGCTPSTSHECLCPDEPVSCNPLCETEGQDNNGCRTCTSLCTESCTVCGENGCEASDAPECQCPEGCDACEQCVNGVCQFMCGAEEVCNSEGTCVHCPLILNEGRTCPDNGQGALYITWCHKESLGDNSCGCCISCPGEGVAYAFKRNPESPEECCFEEVIQKSNGEWMCCSSDSSLYDMKYASGYRFDSNDNPYLVSPALIDTLCCKASPLCQWGLDYKGIEICYRPYQCCPEGSKPHIISMVDRGEHDIEFFSGCCAGTVSLKYSCDYTDSDPSSPCYYISGGHAEAYTCSTGWIEDCSTCTSSGFYTVE